MDQHRMDEESGEESDRYQASMLAQLREELHWALTWVTADVRRSPQYSDRYKRAVRLTMKPDPQAWRDGLPK